MKRKLIEHIASELRRVAKGNDEAWNNIDLLEKLLPHGSGIDNGITISTLSTFNRVVITFEFHHMENGMYVKWTTHKVIITPSIDLGFEIRITGLNFNGIKDYLYDVFDIALNQMVEWTKDGFNVVVPSLKSEGEK